MMGGSRVVVIGASALGCAFAGAARGAGLAVTLIDEHPQAIKSMSFDAPYYYGNGLPQALRNRISVVENVLTSHEALIACAEAGVDIRTGTIAWGAFQNGPNTLHIGTPKVGIVHDGGNELIGYDHLVLATGSRDFVPSFRGWELPGVFGAKAGVKLIDAYQCFEGTRTLVLGSGASALAFVKSARRMGVTIAGLVEPTGVIQAPPADQAWLRSEGIDVFLHTVIEGANGGTAIASATLVPTAAGGSAREIACDTICVAIASLPNIELAAAMGCGLEFSPHFGTWLPRISERLETTRPNVYWLSDYNRKLGQVACLVDVVRGAAQAKAMTEREDASAMAPGAYMRVWAESLLRSGGQDVVLCQCETVSRGEVIALAPPRYLGGGLRQPKSPVAIRDGESIIDQDLVKRMTRVGMGHCQGKRCRDEAALLLSLAYGVELSRIKPATYRFPVRPLDLALIATEDDTIDTRERWPHWLEPYVQGE